MDSNGDVVLLVEDEPAMTRVLTASLKARGYRVVAAPTGQEALDRSATEDPAVVILDLGLPDLDGIEVCRRMREWSQAPIVVVTADGAEDRKIQALDEGADDYVTKPFSMPELLARLRVAVRHSRALGPAVANGLYEVGDLRIDVSEHSVTQGDQPLDLTPKEFAFLALLARQPGKILTHRAILRHVWGPEAEERTEYLRTYANQLRKKLQDGPGAPRLVTEPAVGYRLIEPE
jgi:two-component system KDP operon response regulator KdpE